MPIRRSSSDGAIRKRDHPRRSLADYAPSSTHMAMFTRMTSLQWAPLFPLSPCWHRHTHRHRPFLYAPPAPPQRANFARRAADAPVAAARLLPDDKPLTVPAPSSDLGFPWDGPSGSNPQSLLLLDGNAILYRAYFKIMAKVQYGSLKDMGSEADWVLTVFTALSTVLRLLEMKPSHVAAAFDYKGFTFRHELYKPYKSGRPPTPDTVCQALSCLKPALLSLGISVVEVAGNPSVSITSARRV